MKNKNQTKLMQSSLVGKMRDENELYLQLFSPFLFALELIRWGKLTFIYSVKNAG
jgi:hypothetical protein